MKTQKEMELEARKWLDHVLSKGAYNSGVLSIIAGFYFQGANDVRNEIKDTLQIEDCNCDI